MTEISAETIYNWRNEARTPNLDEDIKKIIKTFNTDALFENVRAYIDYICAYFDHHEDLERDTCSVLVAKDGV
jgi:hypothetical protein